MHAASVKPASAWQHARRTLNCLCNARCVRCRRIILTVLLILALVPALDAAWLTGKALLAQQLIERAWERDSPESRPWPWADTYPVAKLSIARINLEAWVLSGASGHALAFGPGLADGSVQPGKRGVTMIAGHRDTSFRPLQHVRIGDRIRVEDTARDAFTYRVTDISIADARVNSVATQSNAATLVLVTCYPFDAWTAGGPLRYVVQATLDATADV